MLAGVTPVLQECDVMTYIRETCGCCGESRPCRVVLLSCPGSGSSSESRPPPVGSFPTVHLAVYPVVWGRPGPGSAHTAITPSAPPAHRL